MFKNVKSFSLDEIVKRERRVNFPFMAPNRLTTERILAEFERVIQSNKEFRLNDTVEINVIHVSMPTGGKRSKCLEVNLEKHLDKKKSIVRIRNEDELCMARALVVVKAKLDNDPRDRQIRDHRRPMQTRLARVLHQNANVPLSPCRIEQAKLFQAYLSKYQISIVSKEYGDKIIYADPEKDKRIYLYMHNNHYDVITKMPGFFARHYYCHTCTKCQATVRRCKQQPEKHRCGLTKCWICGKYVQLEGHRCYIQPETKKKKKPISEEREEEEMPENGY